MNPRRSARGRGNFVPKPSLDAGEAKECFDRTPAVVDEVRECLPRLTSGVDKTAIVAWANTLATCESYYDRRQLVGLGFLEFCRGNYDFPIESNHLPMTIERVGAGSTKPPYAIGVDRASFFPISVGAGSKGTATSTVFSTDGFENCPGLGQNSSQSRKPHCGGDLEAQIRSRRFIV